MWDGNWECLSKNVSISHFTDMIIKKGEGSEGAASCICKKTDDNLVTEEREI